MVLDRGRLAMGPETAAFEAAMRDACGTEHAVAVSSGTAALHLIVRALGIQPGAEVITTPYSFVASANALLFEGIKPVFVDVEPDAFNISVDAARGAITDRTQAILAVDVFGVPADWIGLERLATDHDLLLIDDACEALGAAVGNRQIGAWGEAAAFGFYPNKQITTGEGGCITTNDADLAATCRSMRNQGRATDAVMQHVRLGYNYRIDEMSAALGVAQLSRRGELEASRARAANRYTELLDEALGSTGDRALRTPHRPDNATRSWFVYVVELANRFTRTERDEVIKQMARRDIECAPYFPAIHLQPFYQAEFGFRRGDFPVCEAASDRTLALPLFSEITDAQVDRVATELVEVLNMVARKVEN